MEILDGFGPVRPRVQTLWAGLTGDKLTQHADWLPYKASVELRNRVVHHGQAVSDAEAAEAVRLAGVMANHFRSTLDANAVRHDLDSDF